MRRFSFCILISVVVISCKQSNNESESTIAQSLSNCTYSRNEKDPSGKTIRVVDDEKFISLDFPDNASSAAYKGEEFLKGYLSCVSVDSVLGIYLDFTIHSEDAFQYYGMIKKGNAITFILKSGKAVQLSFGSTFSGNTNLSKDITEYSSFVYLPKSTVAQLMSEELTRVKIEWSKKEETYIVINPKVLINQLPCVQ